jgi:2-methylcitrate dehydratase PrpD
MSAALPADEAARMPPAVEVTAALAAFVSASAAPALPAGAAHDTGRAVANWLACALGAIDDPSVAAVLGVASGLGGNAQASVVGRRARLDVVNASLVNAVAANALDYDDMHVPTLIHPTGAVVAAAFALGEHRRASGQTLIAAVAAGIDVECRLGAALFPRHYDSGWHITSTLGTLGAAAAASVIAGLDATRTAHALGIAATQTGGLRAMLPNACKSFNIGRAAAGGALAVLLAEAGFDSEPRALEARFGLFDVFGWPADPAAITDGLGERYRVSEISLKPYPCGVVIHPVIDACLALAQVHDLAPDRILSVTIFVHPRTIELAGKQHPDSEIGGRFSFFHAAALAFTRRSAGLAAFDGAAADEPRLQALRGRMAAKADDRLLPRQARVVVRLDDGTQLEHAVDHPSGSPARPLTDAQLREKFMELACRSTDNDRARGLFDACMGLDRLPDVADLRRYWT